MPIKTSQPRNEALLDSRGLRGGIQRKAYRNKPLARWAERYNQLAGKVRYKIERVFGSIKRWWGVKRYAM